MPPTLSDQDLELLLRALCGISSRLDQMLRAPAKADPRQFMPRTAIRVDLPASHLSNNVVPAFGTFTVTWDRVPQGALGVVAQLGVNSTDFDNTTWTALVNGVPVSTFNALRGAFGTLAEPQDILPIDLNAGDVFSFVGTDALGAGLTVGVRTIGWFWFPEGGA